MSFVGLWTGYSGLQASQVGLDLTANNVANAHTAGHTRQRVDQSARLPYQSPVGPLGTGVQVDELARVRDAFLDTRARTTAASATHDRARATLLERAEAVLAEPDQGLSVALDDVWDAFEDLVLHPAEPATRQQAESALTTFAARVDAIASGWQALRQDTAAHADALVVEVGDLLERVHEIQVQVMDGGDRPVPGSLLDERDLLLDRLAELAGTTATRDPSRAGAVIIRLGGETLLEGRDLVAEPIDRDLAGGELGGTMAGLEALDDRIGALGAFAARFASEVGTASGSLDLVTYTSVSGQVGSLGVGSLPASDDPFDASLATAVADLRFRSRTEGQDTLAAGWRTQVVQLAGDVRTHRQAAEAKEQIASAAGQARMSVHGVSIDEEMVHLVQYQRALEASSRIMTAVDEALDVLINRTGLVGR